MKKLILFLTLLVACPLISMAQDDDMYFVPTKKNVEKANARYGIPNDTYYSGSNRSVDEYNRRGVGGSSYEVIGNDTSMIDVINFSGEQGVYPDSTGDFSLTKKMSRWEGYTPSEAYWDGYNRGRSDEWYSSSWHSPWYYSYYPWYDSWYYYDPWYYHYGYWGWGGYYGSWYYRPYYYYGGVGWGGSSPRTRTYARTGNAGTISRYGESHGRFSGARSGSITSGSSRRYGSAASGSSTSSSRNYNTGTSRSSNFGGTRSSSSFNNSVYSSGSSTRSGYSGAGSSSSSRSGNFGGGGGGSRSGGGIGGSSRGGGRR